LDKEPDLNDQGKSLVWPESRTVRQGIHSTFPEKKSPTPPTSWWLAPSQPRGGQKTFLVN